MRRLLQEHIFPALGQTQSRRLEDAAQLEAVTGRLAFTTDSYVVSPLFFPGGDIGALAVHGTINDLAVACAQPLALSLALILEEGLPVETLTTVLRSAARAAAAVSVPIVAGDTKVVPRGAADGLFLTVAGVGVLQEPIPPGPESLTPGDELLVSGPIGQHGLAVLACREGLGFDPAPTSDSAPLLDAVAALRAAQVPVKALRDATRGGVAAVLHEWAEACGHTLAIDEARLPISPAVRGAAELLGLDPVHVACEGVMVVAVVKGHAQTAREVLRTVAVSAGVQTVGAVQPRTVAPVVIRRALGREQPLDQPLVAALPRIC